MKSSTEHAHNPHRSPRHDRSFRAARAGLNSRSVAATRDSDRRMQDLADEGIVIYSVKDGKDRKAFDAPDWLAAMCSHVPNRGERMVIHDENIGNFPVDFPFATEYSKIQFLSIAQQTS